MENIALWISTVIIYLSVWLEVSRMNNHEWPKSKRSILKILALLAVLCLPINVGGSDIFTIAGNASSSGSVYSIASLYQNAGKDAVSLLGLLTCQKAGRNSVIVLGVSVCQESQNNSTLIMGVSIYQSSAASEVWSGAALYQTARIKTLTLFGVAIYQKVPGKSQAFGALAPLTVY